ncbi:MAG: glycoside hydrolase family 20 zincin-like fold domain-containing protein [Verrucomicrobiota bacterium]
MNSKSPALLPRPRSLRLLRGRFALPARVTLQFDESLSADVARVTAKRLQIELERRPPARLEGEAFAATKHQSVKARERLCSFVPFLFKQHAGPEAGAPPATIRAVRTDFAPARPEGYAITIDRNGVRIEFREAPGLRAAIATLRQLLRQYGWRLPCLKIRDWPDFPRRGVMLDVSRGRVPKLETLLELVEHLADFKINELQLYTEHTFAYRKYKSVWRSWGALTGAEIRRLDACCRELGIDLVPNQNSFGHLRHFLEHPRFKNLAEVSGLYEDASGEFVRRPSTLAPNHPGALPFLRALYDELLPNFSSQFFNVGCDETFDLGLGRSKKLCERIGKGRVYIDFLKRIHHEVSRRGKRMMFWGDIILKYPELIKELAQFGTPPSGSSNRRSESPLPPEGGVPGLIALNWGYEANHPFEKEAAQFAKAKIPFYVCPGTSTWQTLIGRHDNALANLRAAASAGKKFGAIGYLITDWGDGGHPQPLAASYLPFLAGAALSWCAKTFDERLLPPLLSRDVFHDSTGRIAKAAFALGHAHRQLGYAEPNLTPLGTVIAAPPPEARESFCRNGLKYHARIPEQNVRATLKGIERQRIRLHRTKPSTANAGILLRELDMAARMAAQSCQFMLWQQALAAGRTSEAERLARNGIRKLRRLEREFNAYWPLRNKATPGHCSAFLKWRIRDYLSGRAGSPLHAAGDTR